VLASVGVENEQNREDLLNLFGKLFYFKDFEKLGYKKEN